MRKSLSGKTPGLSGDKGMDRKKLKNIAIGTVLGVVVLLVIAFAALTLLNHGAGATPTPTPAPSATPTMAPTPTPAPAATPTPIPSGRVYSDADQLRLSAYINGNSGILQVGITVAPGAANVNVSNLSISLVCEGKNYPNVWTIRPMDWDNWHGNYVLTSSDNVAPTIDTKKLGIPQGKPLTIKVTRNSDPYGEVSVAPTY